jgi:hypothetical protein
LFVCSSAVFDCPPAGLPGFSSVWPFPSSAFSSAPSSGSAASSVPPDNVSAAKALKPSAGVFGIIMGILLIISFNLIDLILGIFILIRSIKYISLIKKV